jgi:hypothetical protein
MDLNLNIPQNIRGHFIGTNGGNIDRLILNINEILGPNILKSININRRGNIYIESSTVNDEQKEIIKIIIQNQIKKIRNSKRGNRTNQLFLLATGWYMNEDQMVHCKSDDKKKDSVDKAIEKHFGYFNFLKTNVQTKEIYNNIEWGNTTKNIVEDYYKHQKTDELKYPTWATELPAFKYLNSDKDYNQELVKKLFSEDLKDEIIILEGGTGSGKSTIIPFKLLNHKKDDSYRFTKLFCSEPRQIAADGPRQTLTNNFSSPRKIDSKHGDRKTQDLKNIDLLFITEQSLFLLLVDELQLFTDDSGHITNICFLIDEAHEKNAEMERLLIKLKILRNSQLWGTGNKIIIMSATLPTDWKERDNNTIMDFFQFEEKKEEVFFKQTPYSKNITEFTTVDTKVYIDFEFVVDKSGYSYPFKYGVCIVNNDGTTYFEGYVLTDTRTHLLMPKKDIDKKNLEFLKKQFLKLLTKNNFQTIIRSATIDLKSRETKFKDGGIEVIYEHKTLLQIKQLWGKYDNCIFIGQNIVVDLYPQLSDTFLHSNYTPMYTKQEIETLKIIDIRDINPFVKIKKELIGIENYKTLQLSELWELYYKNSDKPYGTTDAHNSPLVDCLLSRDIMEKFKDSKLDLLTRSWKTNDTVTIINIYKKDSTLKRLFNQLKKKKSLLDAYLSSKLPEIKYDQKVARLIKYLDYVKNVGLESIKKQLTDNDWIKISDDTGVTDERFSKWKKKGKEEIYTTLSAHFIDIMKSVTDTDTATATETESESESVTDTEIEIETNVWKYREKNKILDEWKAWKQTKLGTAVGSPSTAVGSPSTVVNLLPVIIKIPGQPQNITEYYLSNPVKDYKNATVQLIGELKKTTQKIIVFLPSKKDIEYIATRLLSEGTYVYKLWSGSNDMKQFEILKKCDEHNNQLIIEVIEDDKKHIKYKYKSEIYQYGHEVHDVIKKNQIVLATPVLETSVTIPWMEIVIDSGFDRKPIYIPDLNMETLLISPISDSNRLQRRGRVGRTRPGEIYHLYTKETQQKMEKTIKDPIASISSKNLIDDIFMCINYGIYDQFYKSQICKKIDKSVTKAINILLKLEIIIENNGTYEITSIGKSIPDWTKKRFSILEARILVQADKLNCLELLLPIICCLENNKFNKVKIYVGKQQEFIKFLKLKEKIDDDYIEIYYIYQYCVQNQIADTEDAKQIFYEIKKRYEGFGVTNSHNDDVDKEKIKKCLYSGYKVNVVKMKNNHASFQIDDSHNFDMIIENNKITKSDLWILYSKFNLIDRFDLSYICDIDELKKQEDETNKILTFILNKLDKI